MNSLLKMAGVFSTLSSASESTIEKLKNVSKNENTELPVFWLSVWRKKCVEKEIQNENLNIPTVELVFCSSASMPK